MPHFANILPVSEYHSQSMNCSIATRLGLSLAFDEIMMPFSSRLPNMALPIGPIGTGIFTTVAPGILEMSCLLSFWIVCALQLITYDMPVENFCRALSSV